MKFLYLSIVASLLTLTAFAAHNARKPSSGQSCSITFGVSANEIDVNGRTFMNVATSASNSEKAELAKAAASLAQAGVCSF